MIAASLTTGQFVAVAAAVAFAAIITSVAGFGFGLMSVPLMSMAIELHSAVVISSLLALVANVLHVYRYRHLRAKGITQRLCVSSVIGAPFGFVVYDVVSDRNLRLILGIVVLIAVAVLIRGINLAHVGPSLDWGAGFLSGVLSTSIATSGPPLVVGLQARHLSTDEVRSTLPIVFLLSGVLALVIFAGSGDIHSRELITSAVAVPGLGVGMLVGFPLRKRVAAERFRVLVFVLLIATAVTTILKALW